jgi:hypothetical protein
VAFSDADAAAFVDRRRDSPEPGAVFNREPFFCRSVVALGFEAVFFMFSL